ncbi:hypothetical protein EDD86DRAFT_128180 [Gorgonomyces haynaldii]|nr:hypothetical protein EDD86DRAFT_128180 [Gorgonomyces haynaldii]
MQVKKSMRVSTVAEPIRLTQQDPRSDSLFSDHMSPVKHNIRRIPSSSLSPPLETIQKMSSPPKHPREISAQVKSEQSLDLSSPPKRERSPSLYQDMPAKKQSKRVKRPAGHRRTSTRLSQNKPKGLEDQSMVEEKRKKVIDSPSPLKQTKRRRTTQFVPSANSPEFRDQNQGFTPINPRLLFAGFKIPDTPHDTSKVHSGDDGSVTPKQPEETPKPLFPQQRVRLGEMSPVPKVSKTGSTFLNAGQSTPTPSVPAKSLELSVSRRGKTVNPRDKNVKPNDEILETYVQKMTVNTGKKAVKQGKNTKRPGKAVQRQKVPTETVGSPSISPPPVRSHLPLDPPLFSSNNLLKPPHVSADLPLDTPKRTKIEDHVKSTPELSRTTDRLTPPPISKKQYAESVTPTRLQESFCQRPVSPQTSPFSSLSKELLEKDQLQDIFNRVHAVDAMILDPRQLCQTSVKSSA